MSRLHRILPAALALALLLSGCGTKPSSPSRSASSQSSGSGSASRSTSGSGSSSSGQPQRKDPFQTPSAPAAAWEGDAMRFPVGAFSVLAENLGEGEGGHSTVLSVCPASSPGAPFQTLTTESPADGFGENCILVADANFDGFPDLGWMYAQEGSNRWYRLWLWNDTAGQFEEEPAFSPEADGSSICSPAFDPVSGTVRGIRRDGAAAETVLCRWEEGALTLRRKILLTREGGTDRLQVLDSADGALTPVREAEGPEVREEAGLWEDLSFSG